MAGDAAQVQPLDAQRVADAKDQPDVGQAAHVVEHDADRRPRQVVEGRASGLRATSSAVVSAGHSGEGGGGRSARKAHAHVDYRPEPSTPASGRSSTVARRRAPPHGSSSSSSRPNHEQRRATQRDNPRQAPHQAVAEHLHVRRQRRHRLRETRIARIVLAIVGHVDDRVVRRIGVGQLPCYRANLWDGTAWAPTTGCGTTCARHIRLNHQPRAQPGRTRDRRRLRQRRGHGHGDAVATWMPGHRRAGQHDRGEHGHDARLANRLAQLARQVLVPAPVAQVTGPEAACRSVGWRATAQSSIPATDPGGTG